ncbi:hypothetical protein TL16_g12523 [Triparma laevis f. inornata]|uniref:Uncharacterized protein n=2 Tax=Triparma laevis TaxID=1534972 RepID=A0A9W7AVT2_9STRA|nr:hypothetical protein TrLO_g5093 [Triparma laevis f. longispina]GMH93054.1 hypothetical protein TL16_g12523 [Triparma laevis f. inornata]
MLWVITLLMMLAILPSRKKKYTEAIAALGDVAEFADGLASFMFMGDLLMTGVSFLCFVLVSIAFRGNSVSTVSARSMKLVKLAWSLNTFVPFLTLLVYAGRNAVDWDGAVKALCQDTFLSVMGNDGDAAYPGMFVIFNKLEGFDDDMIVVDKNWGEATAEAATLEYCKDYGWEWNVQFFGEMDPNTSHGAITLPTASEYEDVGGIAVDPEYPDANKILIYVGLCSTASVCPASCDSSICALSATESGQFVAYMGSLKVGALMANSTLRSSEFIVGVILGLYAVKMLLPPAISVVKGLMSGLETCRQIFPSEALLGRAQQFVVLVTIPTFASFLASTQQIAGSHLLAPAVILLIASDTVVLFEQNVLLSPKSSAEELLKSSAKRGLMSNVMLVAALLIIFLYLRGDAKLSEYVELASLIDPLVFVAAIFDSTTRAIVTRVFSVDLLLHALWKQHADSEEGRKVREAAMGELTPLFEGVEGGGGGGWGGGEGKVLPAEEVE